MTGPDEGEVVVIRPHVRVDWFEIGRASQGPFRVSMRIKLFSYQH